MEKFLGTLPLSVSLPLRYGCAMGEKAAWLLLKIYKSKDLTTFEKLKHLLQNYYKKQ